MHPTHICFLQTRLAGMGLYTGAIDGLRGPLTDMASRRALSRLGHPLPQGWAIWPGYRHAAAALQVMARQAGFDPGPVDGHWGLRTLQAVNALIDSTEEDRPDPPVTPHRWPSEGDVPAFYGPHGTPEGARPPLVQVPTPWLFRIAWDLSQTRRFLWAHEKTAASVTRILSRIHHHYGAARIHDLRLDIFSGDYAPRLMRGSRTRWSMHAWGIAYDFDDTENRLHWGADRARLARPDYRPFWEIWEAEGWVSLGRTQDRDWMHVQAAHLD
ncbi:M15 family metallopeptidase [Paragemmobacter ruber]|uniref:M15 family peptidase n=1 Tax=Paragemmobacter ruber TaxID=1985673 RepID=A0ABW9Y1R9_9RHOB|nr:M15 family metallopeptidase [Rhodobacter ruber]NBE06086.1 M15 family peptidase [Rhodobacter ruber]